MNIGFPLIPEQASTMAAQVDLLVYYLLGVSVFFASLICALIVAFVIKYRRRSDDEWPGEVHAGNWLEITWTVIPLGLTLIMFVWGAKLYFIGRNPPPNAVEVTVVAKQWMWKVQHPEGASEINELHVPVGQPIKLKLISQDVIHDFSVPAFRLKQDVLPGRYTTAWFEATKPGVYHLFCDQYCGVQHSGMVGHIVVMTQPAYETWVAGNSPAVPAVTAQETQFRKSLGREEGELANQ
jgi:cytochrome c oxidase subunit 2